jgi:hypothetical protein
MPGDLGEHWKSIARGKDFHVRAVARVPRADAIALVEEAVRRHRGDILDFKMFSNLSLCLIAELDREALPALLGELVSLGWTAEVEPEPEELAGGEQHRLEGTIQVTFPEGDGELVIPTPAVPG